LLGLFSKWWALPQKSVTSTKKWLQFVSCLGHFKMADISTKRSYYNNLGVLGFSLLGLFSKWRAFP